MSRYAGLIALAGVISCGATEIYDDPEICSFILGQTVVETGTLGRTLAGLGQNVLLFVYSENLTHSTPEQKRRSILLVILFTFLSTAGQYLIKRGANGIGTHPALPNLLTDFSLLGGLALYGVGAVLMVLALQHGELSVLYPMISLSYVWVAILSVLAFHEQMNVPRIAGIIVIVLGVGVLGRDSRT